MTLTQTALRWVQLNGPRKGPNNFEPFWSLYAGAPYHSDDSLASYAHPIRTLAIDGEDSRLAFGGAIAQDRPFHPRACSTYVSLSGRREATRPTPTPAKG
jgi:hypothetical protein